jgi:hypothetical protein
MNFEVDVSDYNFDIFLELVVPGPTLFFQLCETEPTQILQILWKADMVGLPKYNKQLKKCLFYARNKRETPFTQASKIGNLTLFRYLVRMYSSFIILDKAVNVISDAVQEAVEHDHKDIVEYILHFVRDYSIDLYRRHNHSLNHDNPFQRRNFYLESSMNCIKHDKLHLLELIFPNIWNMHESTVRFCVENVLYHLLFAMQKRTLPTEKYRNALLYLLSVSNTLYKPVDVTRFGSQIIHDGLGQFSKLSPTIMDLGLLGVALHYKLDWWVIRDLLHTITDYTQRIMGVVRRVFCKSIEALNYHAMLTILAYITSQPSYVFADDIGDTLANSYFHIRVAQSKESDIATYNIYYALAMSLPKILTNEDFLAAYEKVRKYLGFGDLPLRADTLFDILNWNITLASYK